MGPSTSERPAKLTRTFSFWQLLRIPWNIPNWWGITSILSGHVTPTKIQRAQWYLFIIKYIKHKSIQNPPTSFFQVTKIDHPNGGHVFTPWKGHLKPPFLDHSEEPGVWRFLLCSILTFDVRPELSGLIMGVDRWCNRKTPGKLSWILQNDDSWPIFTYIYPTTKSTIHVGKYTIHGWWHGKLFWWLFPAWRIIPGLVSG